MMITFRISFSFFLLAASLFAGSRVNGAGWQQYGLTGGQLPEFIKNSIQRVPAEARMSGDQVVAITDVERFLSGYLPEVLGCNREDTRATIEAVKGLSEFTLNNQYPIFVVTDRSNSAYHRLLKAWEDHKFPDQMEMVLASDLWHEYHHVLGHKDEVGPLQAQVSLLRQWRQGNLLTVADKYLLSRENLLAQERKIAQR